MNTNNKQESLYPSIPPQEANPFHQPPPHHHHQTAEEINPFHQTPSSSIAAPQPHQTAPLPPPSAPHQAPHHHDHQNIASPSSPPNFDGGEDHHKTKATVAETADPEKWGTHVMGHPAVPTCHPDNKKAALWGVTADGTEKAQSFHYPYLQYQPIDQNNNNNKAGSSSSSSNGPQSMLHIFNSWSHKAESMANNIWHNLKTGTSVSGAAWSKMNVQAKALTGGGFEALYKQSFSTFPNEKLHKSFACYLSTSTGPVAGTLYLSNIHAAFCSDRPLSFTAPSDQVSWSYYKVMVPLGNVASVNPVAMKATEKYLQIVTIDGHDFWFMGFVNYEKASKHLTQSLSTFVAPGVAAVQPPQYDQKPAAADHHDHDHDHNKAV